MDFRTILKKFKDDRTRCIINGLGIGEMRGLILEVQDDYIAFELCEAQKEKNSQKEKVKKEIKYIPISNIFDLSEGEREIVNASNLSAFNK